MAVDPTQQQSTSPPDPSSFQPAPLQVNVSPLQTYQKLQSGFNDKLNAEVNPAIAALDDQTFAQVQQHLLDLQAGHPIFNGQQAPHPDSILARQKGMSAGQIASEVGKQTVATMVTQPFNDFINTWKRDWKTGLMETLGGAAVIGGLVGLEAITGGAATPFIFAAGAALVAPGMMHAWAEEMANPTDSNLVKALVNTSTGILSVGVPTRGFAGMGSARKLLSGMMRDKNDLVDVNDVRNLVVSGMRRAEGAQKIRSDVPVEKQLEVLHNTREGLDEQFSRLGVDTSDKTVADLLSQSEQIDALRAKGRALQEAGEDTTEVEGEIAARLADGLPTRLKVAHEFLFLPSRPYQHVDVMAPIEAADPAHLAVAKKATDKLMGTLRQIGRGHGLDYTSPLAKGTETMARFRAGDPHWGTQTLNTHWEEAIKGLGISSDVPAAVEGADAFSRLSGVEQVLQGVEDPELWKQLTPQQQILGQTWVRFQNAQTAAELRRGTISTALLGAVPRYFTGIGEGERAGPVAASLLQSWLDGAKVPQSRLYQAAHDLLADDPDFQPTMHRLTLAEKYGPADAQKAAYDEGAPLREVHALYRDQIQEGRRSMGGLRGAVTRASGKIEKNLAASPSLRLREAVRANGGATYHPLTDSSPKAGFSVTGMFPKHGVHFTNAAHFTPEVIQEYMTRVEPILKKNPNAHVGVWKDGSGHIWMEIAHVTDDKAEAIKLAGKHHQEAIYDLAGEGTEIRHDDPAHGGWQFDPAKRVETFHDFSPERGLEIGDRRLGSVGQGNVDAARAAGAAHAKLTDSRARSEAKLAGFPADWATKHGIEGDHLPHAQNLLTMDEKAYAAAQGARPPHKQLVTGIDAIRINNAAHAMRMAQADIGNFYRYHANANLAVLQAAMPAKLPMGHWANQMEMPEFKDLGSRPDILDGRVFSRGPGGMEANAAQHGYFQIHPAVGKPGDLHYQPPLFSTDEKSKQILKALDSITHEDAQSGLVGALTKVSNWQRMVTFATPFWHAFNVTGRALAFFLADPAVAGAATRSLRHLKLHDPEAMAALEQEFAAAGGKHAVQHQMSQHLQILEKERTGQSQWPGALRTMEGPVDHVWADGLERGFWKMVDDVQMTAYAYGKHRLEERMPNADKAEIHTLAAEYANNVAGFVNPLYMSRLYKHVRGLVWFAPSYWATMLRGLSSSMPGASRLSQLLADKSGGQYVRFGAVPLQAIDQRSRIELVRMQRQFMTTYLMTGVAAADMMNVIFSGRHIWDNDEGHKFDVSFDNLVPPERLPGGEVRHSYTPGIPFFKQSADVMNALGLGHDWGFGHQLNDETWRKQDLAHKTQILAGSLIDGVRRTLVGKTSGVAQAGYGIATGNDMSADLGRGVKRKIEGPIGRFDALLNLIPSGNVAERAFSDQKHLQDRYAPESPEYLAAQKKQAGVGDIAGSAVNQYLFGGLPIPMLGHPAIHHMGVERPGIDDDKMTGWYKERNQIHDTMKGYSKAVFSGSMTPLEYQRHKEHELTKLAQLDADTFGKESSAGSLAGARHQLAEASGLNQQGLTDEQWFERYGNFEAAWEQMLTNAAPATRAAWWDMSTAQWTDADHLVWEAKQLRNTLMSSIDGVGGQHIRAYQSRIAPLLAQPMSQADRQAIEQADPYYATYKALLREMSRTSALGAFVSAFTSPNSQTRILPEGLSEEEIQTLQDNAPGTFVRSRTARDLAARATKVSKERGVAQAGGSAQASPEFVGQANEAIAAAAQGVQENA